jgi:hypothetical protein
MQPTYSFSEIKSLIPSLDLSTLPILQQLVEEENNAYSPAEIKALYKFISLRNRYFTRNAVKVEYLLSFN